MSDRLSLWTIYRVFPLEYPNEGFAVREWRVGGGGQMECMSLTQYAMTLEGARELLPPGLYRTPRDEDDDPAIVETWI